MSEIRSVLHRIPGTTDDETRRAYLADRQADAESNAAEGDPRMIGKVEGIAEALRILSATVVED